MRHPRQGEAPSLPPLVAREQRDSNREPASKDGRDRSPGRTSSPTAEVGVDAQTPEGRIPERNPESALFSPSPVVGQEQPPTVRTHVPETESSESDASDEPGPKEDPPHLGARPALDLEGDPEAAELDQEEAGGAEPPSAQLELAILNGLDISSLLALRDLSTRASTTVHIPWPPVGMERTTPEWRQKASQAMAFLLSITAAGVAR